MSLWRSIVQGFGLAIGARAAHEALEKVEEALDARDAAPPKELTEAERTARAKADAKAAAKRAKEQAAEAKRREREIDDELAALKKKVAKDPR
jgi:hypothetical protein